MTHKCCIFVDGENLRHSLVKLFDGIFDKRDYLPKKADWAGFFDWLVKEATGDCARLRTYWYCIEQLDFRPYLPLPRDPVKLKALLCRHPQHRAALAGLAGPALGSAMDIIVEKCNKSANMMVKRFDFWRTVQDNISHKNEAIEFRRAGAITYDLFTGQLGQEKAVDVKLAVDTNELRSIYDTAIIVSGDQDYVPAVQVVKDHGKRVINVAFESRNGRLLPGGARRLNQRTDKAIIVKYDDLKAHMHL